MLQSPNTDQSQELTPDQIKSNLQRYSPFYRQAMHFADPNVETLFYVAHESFSSEKALEKINAFELFKDKKIVFVELNNVARSRASDLSESGHSEHQGGNSAHFTVKVKDKESDTLTEYVIVGDGKCGIGASIMALREIVRGDAPLLPEVLIREGATVASTPPQNGDIVQSVPNNPYDDLLKKIYKPLVKRDENGHDEIGDLKLHHCVKDGLSSYEAIFGEIQDTSNQQLQDLQRKVDNLLTHSDEPGWLEPQDVHKILTNNLAVSTKITEGRLKNISPCKVFSAQGAIPPTILPGQDNQQVSREFAPYQSTFSREGIASEGMELESDKTLKHEFRIIVLNIVHEWIEAESKKEDGGNFSKMEEDDFLKNLITQKLGGEYANKIQTAFGGGEITFKSLLAIDEDGAEVGHENLKKERETFYSAPCGEGKKVFEKILDIAEKCTDTGDSLDLLEDFKKSLVYFSELFLDKVQKERLQTIKDSIESLSSFCDEADSLLSAQRNLTDHAQTVEGEFEIHFDKINALQPPHLVILPPIRFLSPYYKGSRSDPTQPVLAQTAANCFQPKLRPSLRKVDTTEDGANIAGPYQKKITWGEDEIKSFTQPKPEITPVVIWSGCPSEQFDSPSHGFNTDDSLQDEIDSALELTKKNTELNKKPVVPAEVDPAGDGPDPTVNWYQKLNLFKAESAGGAPAPAQPVHAGDGPAADAPKVGPNQDLDNLGELMYNAYNGIVKAFGQLDKAVKEGCEKARKYLLERVNELEKNIEPQEKNSEDQGGKANKTPDNNPLPILLSALRSCLERDNKS
jgi:hypothetical protein